MFREVQKLLKDNSQNGGAVAKNKHGALLKGLLKCGHCGAAMTHTYAKKGNRLYRYYMCVTKMKRGKSACPTPTLPAQEIEDFVVSEIRKLARDPELLKQVFAEASRQQKKLIPKLEAERKQLLKDRQARGEEIRRLVDAVGTNGRSAAIGERLGELEGVVARIDGRIGEIDTELASLRGHSVNPEDVAMKLVEFEEVWEVMYPGERVQLVQSLIESITTSGGSAMTLHFRRA